jgi:hypothetical protein
METEAVSVTFIAPENFTRTKLILALIADGSQLHTDLPYFWTEHEDTL